MNFVQVITTTLDFATANDGTIQSYPAGCKIDQIDIQPRTKPTKIHIEKVQPGVWQAQQTCNAVGEEVAQTTRTITTEQHLLEYLTRYWDT